MTNPADLTAEQEAEVDRLVARFAELRPVADLFPLPRPPVIAKALREAARNLESQAQ